MLLARVSIVATASAQDVRLAFPVVLKPTLSLTKHLVRSMRSDCRST